MRKRCPDNPLFDSLLKKPCIVPTSPTADIKSGMLLTDTSGKKWRLGRTVGTGGFGEIFLASDNITQDVKADAQYVAKVESHTSGPLFVEIHCYLNIAKLQMINDWKSKMGIKHLGIPHHVAFGSYVTSGTKYRFLIIPRFENDLEKMFQIKRHKFNLKTVLTISLQIIDVLQYIHSQGYLHLDIKASNIGLNLSKNINTPALSPITTKSVVRYYGCMPVRMCKAKKLIMPRVLRPNCSLRTITATIKRNESNSNTTVLAHENFDRVYLLDYGLACKYTWSDGTHKEFSKDQRRAHAGTLLFCSRDAHLGAQSRRSDLECLGYNLIYWLTSNLPWSENEIPDVIYKKKLRCIENLKEFIDFSFNYDSPNFVYEYFYYISNLKFDEAPDYNYCKLIFRKALQKYGYKDDMHLDFDNSEALICKQKKAKCNFENFRIKCAIQKFKRTPLSSNRHIRPILRKQIINKKLKKRFNWSKILMDDPEILIKEANKKMTESNESNNNGILNLDIYQLNPNATMLEIFNRSLERLHTGGGVSPNSRGDCAMETIAGYTPAMMEIYNKKRQREEMEAEVLNLSTKSSKSRNKVKKSDSNSRTQKPKNSRTTRTFSSCKKEKKGSKVHRLTKIYCLRGLG